MGKNKKKHKSLPQASPQAATPVPAAPPPPYVMAPSEVIAQVHEQALGGATEADIAALTGNTPPEADLGALARKAQEAIDLCQSRERRAAAAEEESRSARERLASKETDLEARERAAVAAREEQEAQQKLLDQQEAQLLKREASAVALEEQLLEREQNAENDFAAQHREALRKREEEGRALMAQLSQTRERIAAEVARHEAGAHEAREALAEELRRRQTEHDAAAREGRERLEADRRALDQERRALETERRRQEWERQDLEEYRKELEGRVDRRVAAREEALAGELRAAEERLRVARAERDQAEARIRAAEKADRELGHRTPQELTAALRALQEERDEARVQLAQRPGQEAVERLQALEHERSRWEDEGARLRNENASLRHAVARANIAVTDLEDLRDQKASLEAAREHLRAQVTDLRRQLDDQTRQAEGVTPFPKCSLLDDELREEVQVERGRLNLSALVEELRHRIAQDPTTERPLLYSPRDLRCFVAGLAMSHLHLLHGISGTGKTSLPLAFARAVGAGTSLIPVQAGWRDRQDLIGHYNTFERRFHESEFLQALYKAQCGSYRDRPFVIVLDEMNLSHPEQYFADLLSALEQDPERQVLHLMTAPVKPAPAQLKDGRTLPIPGNVWFVGTANQDETTKDFADKTYDRAHVMELPRHREPFSSQSQLPRAPLSLKALQEAFDHAQEKHEAEGKRVYRFFDERLADVLDKHFQVGWGNRLERQAEAFVPVVIEAGGSISEAADHLAATKLFRKIRHRHDTRPDDLRALRKVLTEAWPSLEREGSPARSLAIIDQERARLHDAEAEA